MTSEKVEDALPVIEQCIADLCALVDDPAKAQQWFSRWIRISQGTLVFPKSEIQLREKLAAITELELSVNDHRKSREVYLKSQVAEQTLTKYGEVIWVESPEGDQTCRVTLYSLSLKGPLNETE